MVKISFKLKSFFQYTNRSKVMGMLIIKAHLGAFWCRFHRRDKMTVIDARR